MWSYDKQNTYKDYTLSIITHCDSSSDRHEKQNTYKDYALSTIAHYDFLPTDTALWTLVIIYAWKYVYVHCAI